MKLIPLTRIRKVLKGKNLAIVSDATWIEYSTLRNFTSFDYVGLSSTDKTLLVDYLGLSK